MRLLYLSSCIVFSYFCTLRLASSQIMLPSTISISYSRMLRVSRSSTKRISFIWTPWNSSALNPSILLMNKLNNFEVFSSSRWFPCRWRAKPRKRHRSSLYGCLVFSSNVRQLIVWLLSRGSGKTGSLHPIGTSLSKAADRIKFVNLWNLHFVSILSRLQDYMTSVFLRKSFNFAKSSWVNTSLDWSSKVLFSYA